MGGILLAELLVIALEEELRMDERDELTRLATLADERTLDAAPTTP
jgi:hypothetical protein